MTGMHSTQTRSRQRYRIAEVGRLTGFAPTTLRFYENVGVLAPPERTAAGYRLYGDRDVERLRLIARAKDLGCTLEEIAGLVEAWDGDECGPVKHRLRSLVLAKVADVQRRIAEQVAFAAQLRTTAASLAGRPVDGPCDDACGCTNSAGDTRPPGEGADECGSGCCPTATAAPVGLVAGQSDGDSPPLACSLRSADRQARIGEWQALLAEVHEREPITDGVRLVFGPTASVGVIARLAVAEHDCCPFFGFAVRVDGRGVALEVTAPADGQLLLESVFGVAA